VLYGGGVRRLGAPTVSKKSPLGVPYNTVVCLLRANHPWVRFTVTVRNHLGMLYGYGDGWSKKSPWCASYGRGMPYGYGVDLVSKKSPWVRLYRLEITWVRLRFALR
jgi:hypothetical protein